MIGLGSDKNRIEKELKQRSFLWLVLNFALVDIICWLKNENGKINFFCNLSGVDCGSGGHKIARVLSSPENKISLMAQFQN